MSDLKIYTNNDAGGELPIDEALAIITDEWIADGNHCHITIIGLRDAAKSLQSQLATLTAENEGLKREVLRLVEWEGQQISKLTAENQRLRELVEKFNARSVHTVSCSCAYGYLAGKCSCGLAGLRNELARLEKGEK